MPYKHIRGRYVAICRMVLLMGMYVRYNRYTSYVIALPMARPYYRHAYFVAHPIGLFASFLRC